MLLFLYVHDTVLVSLADIGRRRGELADAQARLEDAVNQYGESAKTRHLRVILLMSKGHWDAALGETHRLAEENPVDPHASGLRRRIRKLREADEASGCNASATIGRSTDK